MQPAIILLPFTPHTLLLTFNNQRSHGTDIYAGLAFTASCLSKRHAAEGGNHCLDAAIGKIENAGFHLLVTNPDAIPSENTFVRIIGEQRMRLVAGSLFQNGGDPFRLERNFKVSRDFLQLAGPVFRTVAAVNCVHGKEQLQSSSLKAMD